MNDFVSKNDALNALERIAEKCDDSDVNTVRAYLLSSFSWVPLGNGVPNNNEDIMAFINDGVMKRVIPVNYDNGTWFDCIFNQKLEPEHIVAWISMNAFVACVDVDAGEEHFS